MNDGLKHVFEEIHLKVRSKSLLQWILYQTDYFWTEIDLKGMEKFILTKHNFETFYEFISAVPCLNRIFANDTGKRSSQVKHFVCDYGILLNDSVVRKHVQIQ